MTRCAVVLPAALAVFGALLVGCATRVHPGANSMTGAVLTGDKGKVSGTLLAAGRPAGGGAVAAMGEVQLLSPKGDLIATVSHVSNWDFELEPGNYTLHGYLNGLSCGSIAVSITTGTAQQHDFVCAVK